MKEKKKKGRCTMAPLLTSGALVSAGDRAAQGRRRRACTQWRGRRRQGRTTGVKHQASAPVEVTNRCLCHGHLATPGHRKTRCHCPHIRHRLVAPTGAYSRVLVPGGASTRYQNPSL